MLSAAFRREQPRTRALKVGRQAAISAKPPSRILQYRKTVLASVVRR